MPKQYHGEKYHGEKYHGEKYQTHSRKDDPPGFDMCMWPPPRHRKPGGDNKIGAWYRWQQPCGGGRVFTAVAGPHSEAAEAARELTWPMASPVVRRPNTRKG